MSPPPIRRILAISGSLRAASSNTAVLQAVRALAPPDVAVTVYDGLGGLPHFNADLDGDAPPPAVARLRALVGSSDGILISSPEYAKGVSGTLKNALDWLVGSTEVPGKPIGLINGAPRATHAQAALATTLATMAARLVSGATITLPLLGRELDASTIATDPALSEALRAALSALLRAIEQGNRDA